MAFYSKSVNDIGIEVDRPKLYREYDETFYQTSNLTSHRESTMSRQASSIEGIFSRYITPTICTAKIDTSMESLSDVLPSIIPPLDLNSSGETMPSTDSAPNVSYTIQKTCDASRISQSNAYYNWLSGKKKLKSLEQTKQKQIQEERQRQLKERKELAEEKYQKWLINKINQSKEKPSSLQPLELQEYKEVCQNHDDSESNRKAWEQKKLQEQRRKKEQELKDKKEQRLIEEKRKKQAARAWQSWLAEAPLKPKPVPLNQGFLSLKGTVSDIYINPNPWREPFEEVQCE